ncbi:hypothetical protein BDFG_04255 [Blastomyces dermatitidis ATCC 26199]|nr:hypothetical protein BDFG_04255 [Blastomyces dermatitidis ATCC 26199]
MNGSLADATIFLRLSGTQEPRILEVEKTKNTTVVTNILYTETEFDITFNSYYDVRNSSQRLVGDAYSENAISFIGAGTRDRTLLLSYSLAFYRFVPFMSSCDDVVVIPRIYR